MTTVEESTITRYITETFEGVDLIVTSGDTFYFYNPDPDSPDYMFPFVTLVTGDRHDKFSNLDRPGVFRLNIGVSKETYRSLFGRQISFQPSSGQENPGEGEYDFTALDKVMPHPVYGGMYWLCILNPSPATFEEVVQPLLAEAYGITANKQARRAARK